MDTCWICEKGIDDHSPEEMAKCLKGASQDLMVIQNEKAKLTNELDDIKNYLRLKKEYKWLDELL